MFPESNGNFPRITFINVVFPQPLGPKRPYLKKTFISDILKLHYINIKSDPIMVLRQFLNIVLSFRK